MHRFTCSVYNMDGGAGRRAVPSAGHSVNSDSVISAWTEAFNSGSGLGAGDSKFLRSVETSWMRKIRTIW